MTDVRAVRLEMKLSQSEFADKFGVCLKTLRQWETGRRQPDGPGRTLLVVIAHAPAAVENAVRASRKKRRAA